MRLSQIHVRILHWNRANVKQRRPVTEKLGYGAYVVVLQETPHTDGEITVMLFLSYSRNHLGQAVLVGGSMMAVEVDRCV